MRQQFILCGLGKVGWRVLEQLRAAGAAVVAVDNRCTPDDPRLAGVPLVQGDCRQADVLQRAGLGDACGVLILTSDDLANLSTALLARQLHPTIRIVVRLFNETLITRLGTAMGNMHALSTSALAAPLLAMIARTGAASGMVRVSEERRKQIATIHVESGSPLLGLRVGDLARSHGVAVVARQATGQALRFLQEVDPDAVVAAQDRLVICGKPDRVAEVQSGGNLDLPPDLLWAGKFRRFSRVAVQSLAMIDWPVKVCTAIFFGVILVSTLVFRFSLVERDPNTHEPIPTTTIDSFYRTVSLMATGADMKGDQLERGTWQKAFISALRILGAALTAAFTAIFTNYLIRANLRGALAVRRIPESGHIVVCGLGNVGFRVVEELLRQREPVVVLEANANNPFIPTARRLGAAVIVGNATVAEVLRQANAVRARAVVAVTSNDLINLEISLLVRELAAKQRVVLRLIDSQLASTLRDSANIRLAVSIPELAAPAVVAALYGDHVHGLFQVEGRMLAIYDLTAESAEGTAPPRPTLAQWSAEQRVVALAWLSAEGNEKKLIETNRVEPGDRLTVVVTLADLHPLLHYPTAAKA